MTMRNAEKDFQKAREALFCADENKWIACLIAGRYVGKRDGKTQEFADQLGRSVSQVENYAYAYKGYRLARPLVNVRKELSPSHYAALWQEWKSIEFHPDQCADYLWEAVENRFNASQLREYIRTDNNVQPKQEMTQSFIEKMWSAMETTIKDLTKRERAFVLWRELLSLIRNDSE